MRLGCFRVAGEGNSYSADEQDSNPSHARAFSIYIPLVHRGVNGKQRTCYVTVVNAPSHVWRSFKRGIYSAPSLAECAAALAGQTIRIGAYGDPAALPMSVWTTVLANAKAVTGYTHAWRSYPALQAYAMASVDTPAEYLEAKRQGWRTFRIRTAADQLNRREVMCPASKEAGHRTTCSACVACGGASSKAKANIAIIVHGAGAKHFQLAA